VLLVVIYRLNHYLGIRGFRKLARLGRFFQSHLSKSEIHTNARIGPGLVASDMGGIGIPNFAIIGENCTFLGHTLLTLGGMHDVDFEYDHIVIGNDCVIGQGARLLGAIELGDGTQVKTNSVVITSFTKPGQIVAGIPARRRGVVPLERVRAWSPLIGQFISTPTETPCADSRSAKPAA
jgi:serine O-acetyltransferase